MGPVHGELVPRHGENRILMWVYLIPIHYRSLKVASLSFSLVFCMLIYPNHLFP